MRQSSSGSITTRFQQAVSAKIAEFGVLCKIYKPTHVVASEDFNPLPGPYSYLGQRSLLLEADKQTQDTALAMGIWGSIVRAVYARSEDKALVGDRYVLVDTENNAWVLLARPASQPLAETTVGVQMMARRLTRRPESIP